MNDTLIVYFRPYKYRFNDETRFEINNFPKTIDIKCVEIFDYLYGNSEKIFKNSKNFKKKIFSFNSLKRINIFLKNISTKYKRVFLINFIPIDNFKCFYVKKLIYQYKKNFKFSIMEIDNSGFPKKIIKKKIFSRIIYSLNFKNIYFRLTNLILSNYFIKFEPDYILVAGFKTKQKYIETYNTKIIDFNTWDNSNLKLANIKNIKKKHIVLVDGAGPYSISDREFMGKKHYLTKDVWYKDLNFFFKKLEKFFKCKIIIANHPNTKVGTYPKHFYGRKAISGKTLSLIKDAKFILTRQSTALSHALYFKKPIIFIYSNQNKKDFYDISIINNISKMIKSQKININESVNFKKFRTDLKINYSLYRNYLKKYISQRKDKLPNSMILTNLIKHEAKKK